MSVNHLSADRSSFPNPSGMKAWIGGVLFTFLIALFVYLLAKAPGFDYIGQMACAIIIAVFYRQAFGYPSSIRTGITFSSKHLLRLPSFYMDWSLTLILY